MPEWPSFRIRRVIFWVACVYLALVTLVTIRDVLKYRATPFPQWNVEALSLRALTPEEAEVSLRLSAPPGASVDFTLGGLSLDLKPGQPVTGRFPITGLVNILDYSLSPSQGLQPDRGWSTFRLIAWQPYARKYWPLLLLGALGVVLLLILAAAKSRAPGWQRLLVLSPLGSLALALQQRYREAWLCNTLQFWLAFLLGVIAYVSSKGLGTPETSLYTRAILAYLSAGGMWLSVWLFQLLLAVVYSSEPEETSTTEESRLKLGVALAAVFPLYGLGQFAQRRWKAAWGVSTLGLVALALPIWAFLSPFVAPDLGDLLLGPTFRWGLPSLLQRFSILPGPLILTLLLALPIAEAAAVAVPSPLPPAQPLPPTEGEV